MDCSTARRLVLEFGDIQQIDLVKSDRYYSSYSALLKLASNVKDDEEHVDLLGLSCAVYGWMPTILKRWDFEKFGVHNPVYVVRNLTNSKEALHFLQDVNTGSPINNSWVGFSKLLHFMKPDLFPIWDKRIAKHFGLKWESQYSRKEKYISYFEFVHDLLDYEPECVPLVSSYFEKNYSYRPTAIRCVEIVLFESK